MPQHSRRPAIVIGGALVLALAAIALGLYLTTERGAPEHEATAVGHVHGLGVNPADGALYVAAHNGVFELKDPGLSRVADRWQDTMGFAVVGPDHFLASGHPDLRDTNLPPQLGLIESTDAAQTWQPLSLQGDADLHALESTKTTLYAYEATSRSLIATDDRRSWRLIDQRQLLDLAAQADQLYATTDTGQLMRYDGGSGQPAFVTTAPSLTLIDTNPSGTLLGIGPLSQLYASADGTGWTEAGSVSGRPSAIDATESAWHVATDRGVFRSADDRGSWKLLIGVQS